MRNKILKIMAVLLLVWLAPAFYLVVVEGYDYHDGGLFYSDREQRNWVRSVLDAEDMARLKQKYLCLTEDEYTKYLDYLMDSLDNNRPTIVHVPLYDF